LHTRWLGAKGAAADDTGQAVLPVLAARAVEAHTLTPGLARMAWKAESWLGRLTVAVAACAVSLMGASVYADAQTQKLTTQVAAVRAEQSALEERMQRVSQVSVEPALLNIADFARKLGDGVRYDPLRLLGDLRRLTPGGIRIQLVKLTPSAQHGKVFLIHGWADVADSSAVVGWVSAMTQAGWRFKAVDPADGAAGTFAYEVVRADAAPGKDRT
jgi:Tfp pilus assembly protein PilN